MKTLTPIPVKPTKGFFYLVLAFLFFIGGALAPVPRLVRADESDAVELAFLTQQSTECSNLDVIFLVDQSSSMGGLQEPGLPPGNDPTLQRKYAVEGMIDMLVDLTLGQCPNSYHRIGIVSFGDEAEVDLPMSIISPADSEEAIRLRDQLKANVRAVNLGKTNTWDAFREARRMFDNSGPTPSGTEQRKQVIILITDGYPCLEYPCQDYFTNSLSLKSQVERQFPFASDLLQQEACLFEARTEYEDDEEGIPEEEINECLIDHPVDPDSFENSTYVWTVLLKDEAAYPSGVLENLQAMSESHAGQMIHLSRNRGDIPSAIREILSYLAGVRPNLLECGKSFAVNPYLRRMVVNSYGIDNTMQITMTYQDADSVSHTVTGGEVGSSGGITVSEYYRYGTNERYVIDFPYPGLWELTSAQNCNGLDVYYDPVQIDPSMYTPNLPDRIAQYDRAPYYDPDRSYFLEYQLRQSGSGEVVSQADAEIFAITVNLNVTDPNGGEINYPMQYVASEQLFRATAPLQVQYPGTYTIHIQGTSRMHEGEQVVDTTNMSTVFTTNYTVFENNDVQFEVFGVTPFVIQLITPAEGSTSRPVHASISQGWPLETVAFPVRMRITDRQGNILTNLDEIFIEPDQAFKAILSAGNQSSTPAYLKADPNIPGEFTAEIIGCEVVGDQTLTVESQDAAIHEEFVPDDRRVEIPFTRGDYLWTAPFFYRFLAGLFAGIIVGSIIYNVAIRTNKVNGTLYFKDGATTIAEFSLYNGTNFKTINAKALQPYPQLMLKKVRVQNAGKRKKVRSAAGDDSVTAPVFTESDVNQGIRINLVTTSGRKFSMDLTPQLPTGYGDDTFAQMIYEPVQ